MINLLFSPQRPITGRRVLIWLMLFFGTIMSVNAAFVFLALDSWPGLSTEHSYRQGLAYNQTLAAAKRQHDLGWRSDVEWRGNQYLSVRIVDKKGVPLAGLKPTVRLVRPTHEGADRNATLKEKTPGVYEAPVPGLAGGQWRIELRVPENGKIRFYKIHQLRIK